MSKKMSNNVFLLKNLRPKVGSKYRSDADKVIAMYENGEIANVKTAFNLVSKLAWLYGGTLHVPWERCALPRYSSCSGGRSWRRWFVDLCCVISYESFVSRPKIALIRQCDESDRCTHTIITVKAGGAKT